MRLCILAALCLCALAPRAAFAELTKGYRILLKRGLQLQGMAAPDDIFHLSTYQDAGYTSINWFNKPDVRKMGAAPGVLWSRWVRHRNEMPPIVDEHDYMPQLFSISLWDEPMLDDPKVFTNMVNWCNEVRANYPDTIVYVNNWAGQASDKVLSAFIQQARPDMISFDGYPWQSNYDAKQSNHIGAAIDGPPTGWFSELRRYRQYGLNTGLPYATYVQTFHAVEDYDSRVYRDPSPSELRLNHFAPLAFNCKVLMDFTYNSGASSLFTRPGGDTHTTPLFAEEVDINRRAKNLGKALMLLTPIPDLHNFKSSHPLAGPASADPHFPEGITTSMLILKGKPGTTNATAVPIGFQNHPGQANSESWWEADKNDPYLRGWNVVNKGTKNDSLSGEVIISWFKPLDEAFDHSHRTNQIYMMVLNALTSTNGTSADCRQEIALNFLRTLEKVVLLDSETGKLQTKKLPFIPNTNESRRQLTLELNGGDAVLFKFDDGAPFVGGE